MTLITVAGVRLGDEAFVEALLSREKWAVDLLIAQLKIDRNQESEYSVALEMCSRAYRGKIIGYLRKKRFNRDQESALEAWNDALFRIYSRVERFDPGRSSFIHWAFLQADYAALDVIRARKGKEIPSDTVEESGEEIETEPLSRRELLALRRTLRRLSPTEVKVLKLKHLEQWSAAEIRDAMGVGSSDSSVRVYIHRANKRFMTIYKEEFRDV